MCSALLARDSNPGIPNPGIPDHFLNPESRDWRCFNPGISGLWETNKIPEFYMIFARKIPFPEFLGPIPGSEAENKLFMRLRTLLYSINLDV